MVKLNCEWMVLPSFVTLFLCETLCVCAVCENVCVFVQSDLLYTTLPTTCYPIQSCSCVLPPLPHLQLEEATWRTDAPQVTVTHTWCARLWLALLSWMTGVISTGLTSPLDHNTHTVVIIRAVVVTNRISELCFTFHDF